MSAMKIERAMKILRREKEFLGITYETLFELCREESEALLLSTLDAYDAYVEWHKAVDATWAHLVSR